MALLLAASTAVAAWQGALPYGAAVRAMQPPAMAGFGKPAAKRKGATKASKGKASAENGLNAKQQWDVFRKLRDSSDQVQTTSVYARLPGEKWLNVGGVIVESPGTRIEAVAKHKRLILEHAARLHLKLAVRPREIEVGFSEASVESLSSDDARIERLAQCAVPSNLVAGFQGLPDTKSGMYIVGAHNRAVK